MAEFMHVVTFSDLDRHIPDCILQIPAYHLAIPACSAGRVTQMSYRPADCT
jgi:hypothetical protein